MKAEMILFSLKVLNIQNLQSVLFQNIPITIVKWQNSLYSFLKVDIDRLIAARVRIIEHSETGALKKICGRWKFQSDFLDCMPHTSQEPNSTRLHAASHRENKTADLSIRTWHLRAALVCIIPLTAVGFVWVVPTVIFPIANEGR